MVEDVVRETWQMDVYRFLFHGFIIGGIAVILRRFGSRVYWYGSVVVSALVVMRTIFEGGIAFSRESLAIMVLVKIVPVISVFGIVNIPLLRKYPIGAWIAATFGYGIFTFLGLWVGLELGLIHPC
ncbi:MAG: hypothetical protein V1809_08545 [Planctomycetota bacterium]